MSLDGTYDEANIFALILQGKIPSTKLYEDENTFAFLDIMPQTRGHALDGRTCVVSGSGDVALHAIEKLQGLGGRVVACSDSDGFVHDPDGIDLELLREVKEVERGRVSDYADRRAGATFRSQQDDHAAIWEIPCEVALPCATQNELTGRDATALIKGGCMAVAEGANMPTTPSGARAFQEAGVAFGPGKAANAGGVATSALEMQQNASQDRWSFEHTEQRLHEIMTQIHQTVHETAASFGDEGNYVTGANIAGFMRVGRAMAAMGLV